MIPPSVLKNRSESWNAPTDLEYAAETLNAGEASVRFVPVCEYFPEGFESVLILPTVNQ